MKTRDAILTVLRNGPAFGLTLMDKLRADHKLRAGSAVYPLLRAMEKEGLLTSEVPERPPSERVGRPRIYYRLTDKGIRTARQIVVA